MGCDIHCYIEYKNPSDARWRDFGKCINPGRNYEVFAKMAGVRGQSDPVVEQRGFPNDCASAASNDHWLYVSDVEDAGNCTKASAERYVQHGSVWRNEEKKWVSHPDHHSHSWMTPDEFEKAIIGHREPEYFSILAAMRSFENQGFASRLVFWFDN